MDLREELITYTNVKFEEVNNRINDLRSDMRIYFFGFLGGIEATLITIIVTKFI